MADVEISYKGSKIVELSESGNKTLKTSGKYCEADILLNYTKSGITPSGTINITENGTHDVTNYASANVNVGGGDDLTLTLIGTNPSFQSVPFIRHTNSLGVGKLTINALEATNFTQQKFYCGYFKEIEINAPNFMGTSLNSIVYANNLPSNIDVCEKLVLNFSTSQVTDWGYAFRLLRALQEVSPALNLTSASSLSTMFYQFNGNQLKEVRFVANTIKVDMTWRMSNAGDTDLRSNDTFVSLANGLDINSPHILTIARTSTTARMNAIIGYVDSDNLFVENSSGNVSLPDFITNVKGWTIA